MQQDELLLIFFYQAGRYKKAIDCYTNGMKCDPKNAVLPANRAMAKLKLKEWNSVESDCTLSIRYISNLDILNFDEKRCV